MADNTDSAADSPPTPDAPAHDFNYNPELPPTNADGTTAGVYQSHATDGLTQSEYQPSSNLAHLIGRATSDVAPNMEDALNRTGSGLARGLGVVSDIADTPGSVVRGGMETVGMAGRGDFSSAGHYLARTLAGLAVPSDRVTSGEVLDNANLPNNQLTRTGLDFTTGLLGGAAASRAFNGLTSTTPTTPPATPSAPSAAATFEAPGLTPIYRNAAGDVSVGAGPLSRTPTGVSGLSRQLNPAEQWTGRAAGQSAISQPRLSAGAASADGAITTPNGVVWRPPPGGFDAAAHDAASVPQSLQNLRRQFTVTHGAGLDMANNPTYARSVGGAASDSDIGSGVRNLLSHEGAQGAFNPASSTATIAEGAAPGTARHEIYHGLMDSARVSGDSSSLGLASRAANAMQQSRSPLLQGLGYTGEEAMAHGVGNGRGIMNQAAGAWNFLDNPQGVYGNLINNISPTAAALYRMRAAPNAIRAGGAAATGVGAYGLGKQLMGN